MGLMVMSFSKNFYKKPFVLRCGYELYLNIKNEINIFKF